MAIDARWQVDSLRLATGSREMEWRGDARLDAETAFNRAAADADCLIVELVEWTPATQDFLKREVRRQFIRHPGGIVIETQEDLHGMVDGAEAKAKLAEFAPD